MEDPSDNELLENEEEYYYTSSDPEEERETPPNIEFSDPVFTVDFHPSNEIISVGTITGILQLYQYNNNSNTLIHNLKPHKSSCRDALFSRDGKYLFSCSSDKSIHVIDVETGKILYTQQGAHSVPINAMCIFNDRDFLATGDDEGDVKLWDLRKRDVAFSWSEHNDYVSSFALNDSQNTLISTSGDGTMCIYHLRKGSFEDVSDNKDDELLSIGIVKNGKTVVVGDSAGNLDLWNWDMWEQNCDKISIHPSSIGAIAVLDESHVITGSNDGAVRLYGIQPSELVGTIGSHRGFPVESVKISKDKKFVASCSHDCKVKFWNIENVYEENEEDAPSEKMEIDEKNQKKETKKMPFKRNTFFDGIVEEQ